MECSNARGAGKRLSRRHWLLGSLAAGAAVCAAPTRASTGRVLFGLMPDASITPVLNTVLRQLQGLYQPDLGMRIHYVPGNATALAIAALHKAPADGSTALISISSYMTIGALTRKLPTVNVATDLVPVAAIGELTLAFAVGHNVPADVKTMAGYARWQRDNPEKTSYGVLGLGGAAHFLGEALARWVDLPLKAVAYKSVASAVDDVSFGSLPACFLNITSANEAVREGRARLLAVCSESRWPGHPDVPTLRELGISEVPGTQSLGLFMSAATPVQKQQELALAVHKASTSAPMVAAMEHALLRPLALHGPAYADAIVRERAYWAGVLQRQRFSAES